MNYSKEHSIFLLQIEKERRIKEAEKTLRNSLAIIRKEYDDELKNIEEAFNK